MELCDATKTYVGCLRIPELILDYSSQSPLLSSSSNLKNEKNRLLLSAVLQSPRTAAKVLSLLAQSLLTTIKPSNFLYL